MATHYLDTLPSLTRMGVMKWIDIYNKDAQREYLKYVGETVNTKQSFERISQFATFGVAPMVLSGDPTPLGNLDTPFSMDFKPQEYALGFEIHIQAANADYYNKLQRPSEYLAKSLDWAREQSAANAYFNLAFTQNGIDGVPLYSTSHPLASGVASNTSAVPLALGPIALENALVTRSDAPGHTGQPMQIPFDCDLIVPVQLYPLASRIVKSAGLQGVADNDTNQLISRFVNVMPSYYMTSKTAWFLHPRGKDRKTIYLVRGSEQVMTEVSAIYRKTMVTVSQAWVFVQTDWRGYWGTQGAA